MKPRPVVRYHGGKWMLAPWIIEHLPPHRTYVEPFGGGGSVLLRKARSYTEVYNDLDGEIVNVFRMVRDRGDELAAVLELTPFARAEFELSYEPSEDPLEQARRTVVRAFQGFGSCSTSGEKTGFRANSHRRGTTPAHDWRNYPGCLPFAIDRLRGVVIENRPAEDVIAQHDGPDVLHYVDPPYVHATRGRGNPYCRKGYRFEMNDAQHEQLATTLRAARGMVVLSGYPSTLYDELYTGWHRVDRAALADGARARVESLWFNAAAQDRMRTIPLFAHQAATA